MGAAAALGHVADFDRPFPRRWYARPTVTVARAMLGTRLVHRTPAGDAVGRVVETEAYVADDPANHAHRGATARNASMFLRAGTLYVFRIHQVHCANAVTRPGQAVLIRALELGSEVDARGPGKLCRALSIDRSHDGEDLVRGPIRLLARDRPTGRIVTGPRVGIRQAAERPLRFAIEGNPSVSRPLPWGRRTGSTGS